MKKTFLYLMLAAGLMGCAKEFVPVPEQTPAGTPMSFEISVAVTRAAKTDWAAGDEIYIFFKGLAGKYLVLSYDGSSWTNAAGGEDFVESDFAGLSDYKLTAVHFPKAVDVTYADSRFSFTSGSKPVYNFYLFEEGKDYTVDGKTVNATLSMRKPEKMAQFHVSGIQDNVADYTFGCSKIKPVACTSVGTDGAITESVLQAGARLEGVADADGGIFAGRLTSPGAAADYTFTVASDDNIYTLTRTGKTLTAGAVYNFPALSSTGSSNWAVTAASNLYLDLGLSVKWAKYNLGATTEIGFGNYFAWGEVPGYNEGKTNFAWSTYVWGTDSPFIKYDRHRDNLPTLEKEDDAAYAALGGKFRMPTCAEIDELLALEKAWVSDYNNTGIAGYKFTGNGQTLFLPAAGDRNGTNLNDTGSWGVYWSSSLDVNMGSSFRAYYLTFNSETGEARRYFMNRFYGFPIRPVSD